MEINYCPWCGISFLTLLDHPLKISQEQCKHCPSCGEDFFCSDCDKFICECCENCDSQYNIDSHESSLITNDI